jgi:acetyl esterase/lipase
MMKRLLVSLLLLTGLSMPLIIQAQANLPDPTRYEFNDLDVRSQSLDVYLPARGTPPYPTVVTIHGGGFFAGGLSTLRPLARALQGEGYAVVNITYRLVPEWLHPAAVEDAFCALAWVAANAEASKLNLERLFVLGESAGGYLATQLTSADDPWLYLENCPQPLPAVTFKGAVAYFPLVDYTAEDFQPIGGGLAMGLLAGIDWQIGMLDDATMRDAQALSLLPLIDGDEPPFLLIHGERDRLVPASQSELLQTALRDVGVDAELLLIPGADHGFAAQIGNGAGEQAYEAVLRFLADLR